MDLQACRRHGNPALPHTWIRYLAELTLEHAPPAEACFAAPAGARLVFGYRNCLCVAALEVEAGDDEPLARFPS